MFKYETVACFGAGIGVTPFASILKHIWYQSRARPDMKLRKVYFYWICRDKEAFEWFQDVLAMLETDEAFDGLVSIQIYLTGPLNADEQQNIVLNETDDVDPLTRLKSKTNYGRPNIEQLFTKLSRDHAKSKIGVFFCGPKPLDKMLQRACKRHSLDGTKFDYNKENF